MAKLVTLVALVIAACAAFFSIYGLGHIFSAAFLSVIIMGSVLEIGKLVAVSYLYRFWEISNVLLRCYLLAATLILMGITSIGTYGYLTSAWQHGTIDLQHVEAQVALLDEEIVVTQERLDQINNDINRVNADYITKRMELIEKYAPEKEELTNRIGDLRQQKLELSRKQLEVEAHVGPIKFVAQLVNQPTDVAITWLTLLIVIVFDPLAVALTIAANAIAVSKQNNHEREAGPTSPEPPTPEPPTPTNKSRERVQNNSNVTAIESVDSRKEHLDISTIDVPKGANVGENETGDIEDKEEQQNMEVSDSNSVTAHSNVYPEKNNDEIYDIVTNTTEVATTTGAVHNPTPSLNRPPKLKVKEETTKELRESEESDEPRPSISNEQQLDVLLKKSSADIQMVSHDDNQNLASFTPKHPS